MLRRPNKYSSSINFQILHKVSFHSLFGFTSNKLTTVTEIILMNLFTQVNRGSHIRILFWNQLQHKLQNTLSWKLGHISHVCHQVMQVHETNRIHPYPNENGRRISQKLKWGASSLWSSLYLCRILAKWPPGKRNPF